MSHIFHYSVCHFYPFRAIVRELIYIFTRLAELSVQVAITTVMDVPGK